MQLTDSLVLSARDVSVSLGASEVLHDVDLDVSDGEFVALLGANGSGKTTLVRALLGVVRLDSGRVQLFGVDLPAFKQWGRIGYVPQRFSAASGVPATVDEVVMSGRAGQRWLRRFSDDDRSAALKAMEQVGLEEDRKERVATLSGGQQQRVLIARALATEPDVLILDEPVSSVDLEHQQDFASTLINFQRGGGTVMLVAHALGQLASQVTRSVVLDRGSLVYDGPPAPEHLHDVHVHHDPGDEIGTGRIERSLGRKR